MEHKGFQIDFIEHQLLSEVPFGSVRIDAVYISVVFADIVLCVANVAYQNLNL